MRLKELCPKLVIFAGKGVHIDIYSSLGVLVVVSFFGKRRFTLFALMGDPEPQSQPT